MNLHNADDSMAMLRNLLQMQISLQDQLKTVHNDVSEVLTILEDQQIDIERIQRRIQRQGQKSNRYLSKIMNKIGMPDEYLMSMGSLEDVRPPRNSNRLGRRRREQTVMESADSDSPISEHSTKVNNFVTSQSLDLSLDGASLQYPHDMNSLSHVDRSSMMTVQSSQLFGSDSRYSIQSHSPPDAAHHDPGIVGMHHQFSLSPPEVPMMAQQQKLKDYQATSNLTTEAEKTATHTITREEPVVTAPSISGHVVPNPVVSGPVVSVVTEHIVTAPILSAPVASAPVATASVVAAPVIHSPMKNVASPISSHPPAATRVENSNIAPQHTDPVHGNKRSTRGFDLKFDDAQTYLTSAEIGVKEKVLLEAVERVFEAASQEVALPPGLHTVVLIDTSNSIHEDLLTEIKAFVTTLITEVDQSAANHQLEENVAMATFGGKCEIIQQFTNDFSFIFNSLGQIRKGGKSPLLIGLAMILAYMHLAGKPVNVLGRFVRPRIIVISDGFITDERDEVNTLDTGDFESNPILCQSRVYHFLPAFLKEDISVSCVGVGECNEVFLKEIAKRCKGTYCKISQACARNMGRYYRYQAPLVKMKNELEASNLPADPVQVMLKYTQVSYDNDDRYEILNLLKIDGVKIPSDVSLPVEQPSASSGALVMKPTENNNIRNESKTVQSNIPNNNIQTMEKDDDEVLKCYEMTMFARLPQLGTRVKRGGEFHGQDQDGNIPGTVVAHESENSIVVKWDSGIINTCSVHSVQRTSEYLKIKPHETIAVGCLVKRGPHWNRGDEDGGENTIGVVVRSHPNKIVTVRWPIGIMDKYKVGHNEICEVEYVDEKITEAQGSGMPVEPESGYGQRVICWQWQDSANGDQMRTLDEESCLTLESMRGSRNTVVINHCGIQLRCSADEGRFREIEGLQREGRLERQEISPELMQDYLFLEQQLIS